MPTLTFPPFELDLTDERLWKAGKELPLRRKPFAILRYLAEHPRRLVTQQELIDAVWGQVAMSDSVLRTHIRDLRRVVGEDLVETVIGRGYRFVRDVGGSAPAPAVAPVNQAPSSLAGRADALATVDAAVRDAVAGRRRMVFVIGEAGIGKTSVVDTALEHVPAGATVLRGACVEQYGAGEAYLPVFDALGRACRDEPRVVDLLVRFAPSWISQLPGVLGDDQLADVQHRLAGVTQARMLRELADAIDRLAEDRPVIVVLEDLHWSDTSTVDLLAVLGRRREPGRVVVIGTLRRAEVARTHPLHRVLGELAMHRQATSIELGRLPSGAIAAYLAQRFRGHAFPAELADALHATTDGHPLFLVAMLDDLERREAIRPHDGRWTLAQPIAEIAARRPDSVTQLIDIQIDRLDAVAQRVIEAASVAGAVFATAAVARALGMTVDAVDAVCELLANDHPYLRHVDTEAWHDGTFASRFGFGHALYQHAALERVPPATRRGWHRTIGEELARRAPAMPAELAIHFDRGQVPAQAIRYYIEATKLSARRAGSLDAITRAYELIGSLPAGVDRDRIELEILYYYAPVVMVTRGVFGDDYRRINDRTVELASALRDDGPLAFALVGRLVAALLCGDYAAVRTAHVTTRSELARIGNPMTLMQADLVDCMTALNCGDPAEARDLALRVRDAVARSGRTRIALRMDPDVWSWLNLGIAHWLLGKADQAIEASRRGVEAGDAAEDPFSLTFALAALSRVAAWRGDTGEAERAGRRAFALVSELGFPLARQRATVAMLVASPAQPGAALPEVFEARPTETLPAVGLVEIHARAGNTSRALDLIAQATEFGERLGETTWLPELERLRGTIIVGADRDGAIASFTRARDAALAMGAPGFALRAAIDLARVVPAEREALARIYDAFTEGHTTRDLVAARELLGR